MWRLGHCCFGVAPGEAAKKPDSVTQSRYVGSGDAQQSMQNKPSMRERSHSNVSEAEIRHTCEKGVQDDAKETMKKHFVGGEGVLMMNAAEHGYWRITLFAWHGRPFSWMSVYLFPYFLACVALAKFGPADDDGLPIIAIPQGAEALAGSALMFLLVFRTNAAYDRWWEGRKHWGMMINRTRDLARQAVAHIQDLEHVDKLVRYTIAFAVTMKHHLRFERDLSELVDMEILTKAEVADIEDAEHLPNFVLGVLSKTLVSAKEAGFIGEYTTMTLDGNLRTFEDELGACERILKTKQPFAYVVHLRTFLVIWLLALPFSLVAKCGWFTFIVCTLISYALVGLDAIGVEVENPFGHEYNDLPIDDITNNTIRKNLCEILRHHKAALQDGIF